MKASLDWIGYVFLVMAVFLVLAVSDIAESIREFKSECECDCEETK